MYRVTILSSDNQLPLCLFMVLIQPAQPATHMSGREVVVHDKG